MKTDLIIEMIRAGTRQQCERDPSQIVSLGVSELTHTKLNGAARDYVIPPPSAPSQVTKILGLQVIVSEFIPDDRLVMYGADNQVLGVIEL